MDKVINKIETKIKGLRVETRSEIRNITPALPINGYKEVKNPSVCVKLSRLQPNPVKGMVRSANSATTTEQLNIHGLNFPPLGETNAIGRKRKDCIIANAIHGKLPTYVPVQN